MDGGGNAPYDNSQFLNNWNYISVTYDGSYKKIYLNGMKLVQIQIELVI